MFIHYQFVNGEKNDVQVSEELGEFLVGMDKAERNAERRETRRHVSLDGMEYEGDLFADDTDVFADVSRSLDYVALRKAFDSLLPQQRDLLWNVFFRGRSIVEIASEQCVGESAIRGRLDRVLKQLQKFLV